MPVSPAWMFPLIVASIVGIGASSSLNVASDVRPSAPIKDAGLLTTPKVDFADSLPLVIDRYEEGFFVIAVAVRNDEPVSQQASFSISGVNAKGAPVEQQDTGASTVREQTTTTLIVKFERKSDLRPPLVGHLVMRAKASGRNSVTVRLKAIKILPPLPSQFSDVVVVTSLLGSILVVLISLTCLYWRDVSLMARMGPPNWTFADSWGSNIALGGALLSELLRMILPEQTVYLNKATYSALTVIFGLFIAAAPTVYSLFRRPVAASGSQASIQYQGVVLAFVSATGFTLWGAFGQLSLIGLLLGELFEFRSISQWTVRLVWGVIGGLAVALFVYAIRTIVSVATAQIQYAANAAQPAKAGTVAPVPLPAWTLL